MPTRITKEMIKSATSGREIEGILSQLKNESALASAAVQAATRRLDANMTKAELAKFMGPSQELRNLNELISFAAQHAVELILAAHPRPHA